MATHIKAIKCPQCGSTTKTETKPNVYQCSNCQTTYFLDSDNIIVNYNHNYHYHPPQNAFKPGKHDQVYKTIALTLGIILGLSFIINVLITIIQRKTAHKADRISIAGIAPYKNPNQKNTTVINPKALFFINPNTKRPVVAAILSRKALGKEDHPDEGVYLIFYDLISKRELSEQLLNATPKSAFNLKTQSFSDGNTYVILENHSVYVLDKENLKLKEADEKLYKWSKALQVGVANVQFIYDNDGLLITTNEGKKYCNFPLIKRLYTENECDEARSGFSTLLPGAKENIHYTFTAFSTDQPKSKLQLLAITYKDNVSGPKDVLNDLSWVEMPARNGGTDFVLIDAEMKQMARILSWKDLTPGQTYFAPKVLMETEHSVIICFKTNGNRDQPYFLQQLNGNTGAVEWTTTLPDYSKIEKIIRYKDGFAGLTLRNEVLSFNDKGVFQKKYKFDYK